MQNILCRLYYIKDSIFCILELIFQHSIRNSMSKKKYTHTHTHTH